MRHKLTGAIAIAALLGVLAACAGPAGSPTPTAIPATATPMPLLMLPGGGAISRRNEINSAALANNLIGDPATRSFAVYLPPGYDTGDSRYPVAYVLQGYTGGVNFVHLAGRLDELIAAGEAREMILVFFNGLIRLGGGWYQSSPTVGDYETFIAEELVSVVDSSYRTLPTRDSRGITGCSMGGYGSLHLAFTYPHVFSVAAPMSGIGAAWQPGQFQFTLDPQDFDQFNMLPFETRALISVAAVAAPNPDNPPFYLDMPYEFVGGQPQAVPEVFQRINALKDPVNDLPQYLDQPIRLRGLMIFQDTGLNYPPDIALADTEAARAFDRTLTGMGIDHEYLEVEACHCCADWGPILEFMSDHLAY